MDLLEASWSQLMGTKHLWNFDPWDFSTQLDMLGEGSNDPEEGDPVERRSVVRVGTVTLSSV